MPADMKWVRLTVSRRSCPAAMWHTSNVCSSEDLCKNCSVVSRLVLTWFCTKATLHSIVAVARFRWDSQRYFSQLPSPHPLFFLSTALLIQYGMLHALKQPFVSLMFTFYIKRYILCFVFWKAVGSWSCYQSCWRGFCNSPLSLRSGYSLWVCFHNSSR